MCEGGMLMLRMPP